MLFKAKAAMIIQDFPKTATPVELTSDAWFTYAFTARPAVKKVSRAEQWKLVKPLTKISFAVLYPVDSIQLTGRFNLLS